MMSQALLVIGIYFFVHDNLRSISSNFHPLSCLVASLKMINRKTWPVNEKFAGKGKFQ
jgi:hypothetical protein